MERELVDDGSAVGSRLVSEPEGGAIAGLVIVHGLGDHAERHLRVMNPLADAGIAAVVPDLPGHGRSGGKRGHIAGMELVDEAVSAALDRLRKIVPTGPIGIAGHSMGALLVLDHFARGFGEEFSWVWLSSALIEPTHGKSKSLRRIARLLSRVWPSFTIKNGVRPGDGYSGADDPLILERERASGTHDRISVRLGVELLRAAERVECAADEMFVGTPVLMTHGDADRVCPQRYAMALFNKLATTDKQFLSVEGAMHEPWNDPQVVEEIRDWMVERVSRDRQERSASST